MSVAAAEVRRGVVPMPRWSTFIGCARAIVAILVLAFAAAATGIWGGAPGFGFALFTSSATLIVFAYYFVALSRKPELYNRWAILTVEAVGTFLWLVTIPLLAGWTAHHHRGPPNGYGFWNAPFGPEDVGLQALPGHGHRKLGIAFAGTAAGLSGLEFGLFVVTLVTFGRALHAQRQAETPRPVMLVTPKTPVATADGENAPVVTPKTEPLVV